MRRRGTWRLMHLCSDTVTREILGDIIMWANMLACWRPHRHRQPPPINNLIPPTPSANRTEEQTSPCNNQSPPTIGDEQTHPDWLRIPIEIWCLILEKLPLEDYIRSATVCTNWLSIARPLKHCSSKPRLDWLMIPEDEDTTRWKMFDISNKKKPWCNIHLPELENNLIFGSSEGWLVVADMKTANFRLFNPFTRDHIELPPAITLPGVLGANRDSQDNIISYYTKSSTHVPRSFFQGYIMNAMLGSSDCGYTVIVTERSGRSPAFARVGDTAWTALPIPYILSSVLVTTYTFFKGIFYYTGTGNTVCFVDLNNISDTPTLPIQVLSPPLPSSETLTHLVVLQESGEILACDLRGFSFDVANIYKLDRKTGKWVEMNSLYGHFLFFAPWIVDCNDIPGSMMCLSSKEYPAEHKSLSQRAGPSYRVQDLPVWISPVLTHLL